MSRSYKKHPCATCAKSKGMKQIFNRKIRRIKEGNPYVDFKKRNCTWDICDYKSITTKPKEQMSDEEKKCYIRK